MNWIQTLVFSLLAELGGGEQLLIAVGRRVKFLKEKKNLSYNNWFFF